MIDYSQNFIGGHRVDPHSRALIEVRSPYDGKLAGSCPLADTPDIDTAVEAVRKAFDAGPWPKMSPAERQKVLARFAKLHATRANEFANLITSENGSALWFTQAVQAGIALQNAAYLKAAAEYPWEVQYHGFPQGEMVHRREPVGVVAAIIPWNAPHQSALVKLFPALLAGCTVILKVSPETALDGHALGEVFVEAGLPEGVLSILAADREVSEYLVKHPNVDKIAFTGSTAAGKRIASLAGEQLKRFSLELGGKSAAIVLPDANIPETIGKLRYAAFLNSGQSCVAQTRFLVSREIHDEFVEVLVADVAKMKVGDPSALDTFIGPLVSANQKNRVAGYIKTGIAEGAKVAIGGEGTPEGLNEATFVRPTVFINVNNTMRIAQEEIFGPVVAVIPYKDTDEAIRIANDSPYGLCGGVWTSDVNRGLDVARQIRTGTIAVNGKTRDFLAPFGGYKQSGIGREFGPEGISEYLEHKAIAF
jgi:aldehyde dehydrogenase (NAD+)